jgi:hypothetical protein
MPDHLDNSSIHALYGDREEGGDDVAGRSLEDAARELGFDPDELFAEPTKRTADDEPDERT